MKYNIHPTTKNTFIQTKDGSSYVKYWSYLRSTLVLEGDSKKSELFVNRRTIDINKIAIMTNKKTVSDYHNRISFFWISLSKFFFYLLII